ncbi:hypothetical protein B0O80DRAFT_494423 [Mortierella sp. GBAus27b]|nr:basic helix-loop-helix protein [Mortierella sp. GBA43]KAI8360235.1 hypothetical protein B0O80DRAFT_494423 [Mortierella sp. GBAus27b]
MADNKDVLEVIDKLTSTIAGTPAPADETAFAESFSAAIAQHDATAAAAAAAVAAVTAAEGATSTSDTTESTRLTEQQQRDHEQLRRIAEQHRQELEEDLRRHDELPKQEPNSTPAAGHDDQHQQVIQHIVSATGEASSTLATVPIEQSQPPAAKPVPGTEEWHKMRRDNHKEVERRRRETINEGINDIARMVPNSDKNKGSVLRQAVKYIQMIVTENEQMQGDTDALVTTKFELEKAVLEKNVAEAAYQSLNVQHDQLKREYEELRKKMDELGDEQVSKKQRTD